MSSALLRIEVRRSVALLLFPVLLGLAWFYFNDALAFYRRFLWGEVSLAVRNTAFFAAPCLAGAAAWMAGRERRRGMGELLGTVPGSALGRQLASLLAVIFWGAAAYLLIAAILVAITARHATWGGPILWPGIVGLLALGTYAALGFLIGTTLPSRFTAPLVAVLAYFVQGMTRYLGNIDTRIAVAPDLNWLTYLSPVVEIGAAPWYRVQPDVGGPQACFLLGLAGLALAGLVARERRDVMGWLACGGCALAVVLAVFAIYRAVPEGGRAGGRAATLAHPIAYTPYCRDGRVPLCVHPAYGGWLDDNATLLARLFAPLANLPGGPVRAEQQGGVWTATNDIVPLLPQPTGDASARTTVVYLVRGLDTFALRIGTNCPDRSDQGACRHAQEAVALWLVRQAGVVDDSRYPSLPAISAAADRFGALPEETRRAWLREHLVALREGRVPLGDLP